MITCMPAASTAEMLKRDSYKYEFSLRPLVPLTLAYHRKLVSMMTRKIITLVATRQPQLGVSVHV